ncbi:MAG: M17 family peptidase N-terminal domain-containing protein [Thermomicrobiales bacterium]
MNIVVQQSDPFATASDALIVPVGRVDGAPDFDVIALPALRDQLASLVSDADFTGKTGSTLLVQTMGLAAPRRLILTGVGDLDALTAESIRKAWGTAVTTARDAGAESVISLLPPASGDLSAAAALTQATAAADMATYRFTNYQGTVKNAKPVKEIDTLAFATDGQSADLAAALETGRAIAAAVSLARDLTNEPGSDLPPMAFAAAAEQVAADHGLEITVYDAAALQEMGANAILAVGKGVPILLHDPHRLPTGRRLGIDAIDRSGRQMHHLRHRRLFHQTR